MKIKYFIFLFTISLMIIAYQHNNLTVIAEPVKPLFNYETTESFSPDLTTANPKILDETAESIVDSYLEENVKSSGKEVSFKFQLADPKGVYLPPQQPETKEVSTDNKDVKTSDSPDEEEVIEIVTPADIEEPEAKEEPGTVDVEEIVVKEKPVEVEESEDKKEEIKKEDIPAEEAKNTEKESLITEEKDDKTDKKDIEKDKQEKDKKKSNENKDKKKKKKKDKKKKKKSKKDKKKDKDTKVKEDKKDSVKHKENTKEATSFSKEDIKKSITEKDKNCENAETSSDVEVMYNSEKKEDKEAKGSSSDDIDYYLKKYTSTLKGEANINEYKHSLEEPFKQSLFYDVLKKNKYETIEVKTKDVTADFKPEAIVSYNVPLGAEGEYACQVMALTPTDKGLEKIWVSELIPGEIDTVMIQDVNNDAQFDIVTVSTTGGVSLLKSVRVYTYNKSKNDFKTIFAMNGIMEGIVNVNPGKILISETFPGGINRAALYVWNGKRFERLEL